MGVAATGERKPGSGATGRAGSAPRGPTSPRRRIRARKAAARCDFMTVSFLKEGQYRRFDYRTVAVR
jgi:hypothetical protein